MFIIERLFESLPVRPVGGYLRLRMTMLVFGSQAFLLTFSEATQERRYKTIYGVSCFLEDETQINSGSFIEGIINLSVLIPTKPLNADWIIILYLSKIGLCPIKNVPLLGYI
ncbi:MAG: hypothetical protein CMG32_02675 [Candidatus Marinimicrobia bacterium]|nr:hypothetical protein [Candidatus Neomarinimicrobiota bacterium]